MTWCMVQMLKRNMSIKLAPQRWQDNQDHFDVVIVFDERLMDSLLEGQQPCTILVVCRQPPQHHT